MTTSLAAVPFDVPLLNPSPNGLFTATQWVEDGGPLRWLPAGVDFRVFNFGGEDAFGVWSADWCAAESELAVDDIKDGERPDFPDTFLALTTYAKDECDLTKRSRDEVRQRAAQVHRLQEPNAAETYLGARMLTDAGTPQDAAGLLSGVAYLEGLLAKTNTIGLIHASAEWAAFAVRAGLVYRSGNVLKSPLGHTWVFGGGYVETLGATLVATSPTYGWRGATEVRDAPSLTIEQFVAIAERSLVVGYEHLVGAVTITGSASENEGFPGGLNFPGSTNFPEGA